MNHLALARTMDAADPLAPLRRRFSFPATEAGPALYFAGNSLGLLSDDAASSVADALDEWACLAVRGWSSADPAWTAVEAEAARLAAPVVGAHPDEIAVTGTLTGNLHGMLVSFYRPEGRRRRVLMEPKPFPSDRYAVASHARWHGLSEDDVILEAPAGATTADIEGLIRDAHEELALVLIGGINYYTGRAFDMEAIAATARGAGCVVGFDLAHAAGNIPLRLHDWDADFAVWCGYKYLNGGPGAPAGMFVHRRHHESDRPRLAGWWGNRLASRFQMAPGFDGARGAAGWQVSTPTILALAPVVASLRMFEKVGMDAIRAKSVALTGFLERQLSERLGDRATVLTPTDAERRGAQLSIRIRGGRAAFDRLSDGGVICDWREPDAIRVAPAPLYNSFEDVARFVERLDAATRQSVSESS